MDKLKLSFAAINPYETSNIIQNVQKEITGKDFIEYGQKNIYPQYLHSLYEEVPVLKSVINALAACFENITINIPLFQLQINDDGETIEDVVRQIIIDYGIYGGFALNILRNKMGDVVAIYNLDFRNIRSDKKNTKFWYSEDWGNKSLGRVKSTVYYKFDPNDKTQATSIFYWKNEKYLTYPNPVWGGAAKSAESLKLVGDFHLNSLYNGLASDYILNFCGGIPEDPQKEEIEENFNEKFTSVANAGRAMLSFCEDFQHRVTVEKIPNDNFIDRYNALEKTCKQDIYTSFNISPIIVGLPSEDSGFKDNDCKESFEITKKLVFEPILKMVKRTFEKIFQQPEVITIDIIDIDWSEVQETAQDDIIK